MLTTDMIRKNTRDEGIGESAIQERLGKLKMKKELIQRTDRFRNGRTKETERLRECRFCKATGWRPK